MSKNREAKHVLRAIRNIPVEQVAPDLAVSEGNTARYCIVEGRLVYVHFNGLQYETMWDDPIELELIARYVASIPERIHASYESALEFVRSQVTQKE